MEYFFGHLIGDFFCQSSKMADNKYLPGVRGLGWCSAHVFIYTIILVVFVGNFDVWFGILVYVPHWLIDRYSLAYQWLRIIDRAHLLISNDPVKASFGAIIYVVIDQTLHAGC